jgi:hypothetical protein
MWISKIICKLIKHNLTPAGACPFTGRDYYYCQRCRGMVPRTIVKEYNTDEVW